VRGWIVSECRISLRGERIHATPLSDPGAHARYPDGRHLRSV